MKKRLTRVLSLLMAGAMIMGTLTACGNNNGATDNGTTQEQTATDSKETPLVVGYLQFSEKFSPFFAESGYDVDAKDMTQVQLITQDRTGAIVYNAIDGETIAYNGTDYTYQGIADVTVDFNEETDKTTYNFKLRDDITFSDGQPLTADDVIFSLYVLADSNYDGSSTLYSQPIVGLKNYRANSTAAETVTVEDVNAVIAEMPEVLETAIIENVITPTLTSEVTWCQDSWEQYADAYGVSNAEEFFVVAYSLDENYSADGKDMDTILADMIAMYGADYKSLGAGYAGDESHYDSDVYALAETVVIERLTEAGEGEEVPSIEGIKKLGDYEVEITTNGFDATTIYSLGIDVAPLHYYGDKALYDYDNNSFGFTRGDLSIVRSKTTTPMVAGAYKFVKYDNISEERRVGKEC